MGGKTALRILWASTAGGPAPTCQACAECARKGALLLAMRRWIDQAPVLHWRSHADRAAAQGAGKGTGSGAPAAAAPKMLGKKTKGAGKGKHKKKHAKGKEA